jgi:hypothetical protein
LAREKSGKQPGKRAATRDVVVTLRPDAWLDPADRSLTAKSVTRNILDRVADRVGVKPQHVEVFGNIGAFSVRAETQFIDQLSSEPEVFGVAENEQNESMVIEPIRGSDAEVTRKVKSFRGGKPRP